MKIQLHDPFNSYIISHHRTIRAAVIASRRHARRVAQNNGEGSFIPYSYRYADGSPVCGDDVMNAKMELDQA